MENREKIYQIVAFVYAAVGLLLLIVSGIEVASYRPAPGSEPLDSVFEKGFLRLLLAIGAVITAIGAVGFGLIKIGKRRFQGKFFSKMGKAAIPAAAILLVSNVIALQFIIAAIFLSRLVAEWLFFCFFLWPPFTALLALLLLLLLCIGALMERKRAKPSSAEPIP